jgi:hypothetical protein
MKRKLVKDRISEERFIKVCEGSNSMAAAAAELELHFNSFKKRAIELGCYVTNQSGKGINKTMPKTPIKEIIVEGKYPHYQTYKLKLRLLDEGYKQNKCEVCGIIDWEGKELNMELDHIDGNRTNHLLSNLRLLCPNCHAQTDTYRAKNKI